MKKRHDASSTFTNQKRSSVKGASGKSARRSKKRRLMMEGLESRQLFAVLTEIPTQPAPTTLPQFTAPRNIGTVPAANVIETEGTTTVGTNNTRNTAQIIPLGTDAGDEDTIDLTGTLPVTPSAGNTSGFSADLDVFGFDLRAGDIIDIATTGAAGEFAVQGPFDTNGIPLPGQPALAVSFASSVAVGGLATPIQLAPNINASGVFVAPNDGRYFLTLGAGAATTTYTVGLRAYRPVTESLAFGDAQILYLDWEGGVIDNNIFLPGAAPGLPTTGFTIVPSIEESLPALGLEFGDVATANALANSVYDEVIEIFEELGTDSVNGDFGVTGNAGDFALRILNSRDPVHRQWFEANSNDPRITRLIIGGTGADIGIPGVLGIAQSVDVGNFDLSEISLFALDGFGPAIAGVPITPGASQLDAISQLLASVAAHEAGHTFGMIHTNNTNNILSISDAGGPGSTFFDFGLGLGPDGIFGTLDDVQPTFENDFFFDGTVRAGFNRIRETLTLSLSSGTVGGATSTGSVFVDTNNNGVQSSNEIGLPGVTVFADLDGDFTQDPGELSTVSTADGSYSLTLPPGSFNVVAIAPPGFEATTQISQPSGNSPAFGFVQINPAVNGTSSATGTVFSDTNGNGEIEISELGVEDVLIFLDLDNDNRPDLFEPNTLSGADGSYSLNFPGPGTFTIRAVLPPGFEQTFPDGGEHIVNFNGTSVVGTFDFGLLPSFDFGDAPDSFGTLQSSNGPSHGILAGLSLGVTVDREPDGQPTAFADGDDVAGFVDDEDGVLITSPLAPGFSSTITVAATNTTGGPAFLQGFLDFNGDGDFGDAGEQFLTNLPVSSAVGLQTLSVPVAVPTGAVLGNTVARFRLSQTAGLGPTGPAASGEVEDHILPILPTPEVANDDTFTVSRNTTLNQFNVLANDFDLPGNPLIIESINTFGAQGSAQIATDGRSLTFTPANGFVGLDQFEYTVVDSLGNRSTAQVNVNVSILSNVPIAVDDVFGVPQNSVNLNLDVLGNDVPSTFSGLTITSVTSGSAGGTIQIVGGGQSIQYTPVAGFAGTEQFTYSVQDSAGQVSSGQVTINLLPGSLADDVVDFSIGVFDPVNINTPIANVQVGDEFLLRVSVDDLDLGNDRFVTDEGVAAAFLDLLYSEDLVSLLNTGLNPAFPFDITFGPLFSGSEAFLQTGSASTPGLIDEVGGIQPLTNQQSHGGPVELFTLRLVAIAPGTAQFTGDPADAGTSETVLLASDEALPVNQLRFGQASLLITPASPSFTSAVDDSFADGLDSIGNPILNSGGALNRLEILDNDDFGPTGILRELALVTNPTFGTVTINNNGTPLDLNDDFFSYQANAGANGLERFTYVIVTDDGLTSTAEVTIPVGNIGDSAIVAFDFSLVEADIDPTTGGFQAGAALPAGSSVSVGDVFGVQIDADDLRGFAQGGSTFVFAGFLDVLFSDGLIEPVAPTPGSNFDFGVELGPTFDLNAATGTAARSGIIDEFGSLSSETSLATGSDPAQLATIFFQALQPGVARIAGDPADSSPFQDTLLFGQNQPVPVEQIRSDVLSVTIGAGEGEPLQNPTLAPDVNDDGVVSPIDALLVVNSLARINSGAEGEGVSASSGTLYTDVNGDRAVTAIDALQVINYLARTRNQSFVAEGEQVVSATPAVAASGTAVLAPAQTPSDDLFADSSEDFRPESLGSTIATDDTAKLVSAGTTDSSSSADSSLIAPPDASVADDQDDDETLLNLLAGDIQGLSS